MVFFFFLKEMNSIYRLRGITLTADMPLSSLDFSTKLGHHGLQPCDERCRRRAAGWPSRQHQLPPPRRADNAQSRRVSGWRSLVKGNAFDPSGGLLFQGPHQGWQNVLLPGRRHANDSEYQGITVHTSAEDYLWLKNTGLELDRHTNQCTHLNCSR